MSEPEPEPVEPFAAEACAGCAAPLRPEAAFCVRCGRSRAPAAAAPSFSDVAFVLRFYVALFLVHGVIALLDAVGQSPFVVDVAGTSLWAAVTVGAALLRRDVLRELYARIGFPARVLAVVALASLPIYVAVDVYVDVVSRALGLPAFEDGLAGHAIVWQLVFTCAFPAVFEEMGFRGVIFGLLGRSLRVWEALLISSFAFAILHLSVPSLVTHLPLGLYFCWLRIRSRSLWPAMLAHFLHNAWWVLDSRSGWFGLG